MKRMKFKKLWIVSDKEQTARMENLSNQSTLVIGENSTGKSSFIKSIYGALGADPAKTNKKWNTVEAKLLLNFEIDGSEYYSLRVGNHITIFNGNRGVVGNHSTITKSSETFCNLLDTPVKFRTKFNKLTQPWPSALFLPFYIDQDTGLSETWNSFSGLNAFKDYKDTLIYFHTGIRPKEYYIAKAKEEAEKAKKAEQVKEREHLEFAQSKLNARTLDSDLNFDPSEFEREIKNYLEKQSKFIDAREKLRFEIRDLQGQRAQLIEENRLALATLKELNADVKYLEKMDVDEIVCPTCNTVHQNNFSNTFRLNGDVELCRDFLKGTDDQIKEISEKIDKKTKGLKEYEHQVSEINAILGEKRGKLTLKAMLEHESRRIAGASLEEEKQKIDVNIGKIDEKIKQASKDTNAYSNKEQRENIEEFYRSKLRAFCNDLNVVSPPEKVFEKIRPVVEETGSELPRLILAYQYAVLHTVNEFSSALFAPIVFDTAQHQDQDETNIKAMIKFAYEQRPENAQFIFGTVDLHDFKFEGHTIETNQKKQLLQKDIYELASSEIADFHQQMIYN